MQKSEMKWANINLIICCRIFSKINFCCFVRMRKHFNSKSFPIYGMSVYKPLFCCPCNVQISRQRLCELWCRQMWPSLLILHGHNIFWNSALEIANECQENTKQVYGLHLCVSKSIITGTKLVFALTEWLLHKRNYVHKQKAITWNASDTQTNHWCRVFQGMTSTFKVHLDRGMTSYNL